MQNGIKMFDSKNCLSPEELIYYRNQSFSKAQSVGLKKTKSDGSEDEKLELKKLQGISSYSPKSSSSPRGSQGTGGRSPVVSRQDSSGTLKTTISLGKNPSIVHSGPFYLMKEPPGKSELTGATKMTHYGLEHSYNKFSGKKVKEQLSSFLPNLPGLIDGMGNIENSSLRSIIEKPPIGGKELLPLTSVQLAGFRLHPGPLPDQYRTLYNTPVRKHKNKHKKNKPKDDAIPQEAPVPDSTGLDIHEKKHKKQKRHEDEKERKKRKKEKKRKRQRHSPEHHHHNMNNNPVQNSPSF